MAIEYNFKYMPLVGKLSGESMVRQTETAINEIAQIVNENTAQAEIINTLAEQANSNSVEALEKANEALNTSSRVYITETSAVNLNNYCESQLIYINNIFSQNLPVESKGFLEVKTNDDKTQATQVFVDDLNKEIYTRSGAITETQVGDITTYTASYGAWNNSASTNYVENMVLIRQNSTAYSVGDIARSTSLASYMLLECTSAGTTGASEPSYEGADVGDVITDGSVSWTIIEYASTDYVDDSIANLKSAYLPANYLRLSGGTITGDVFAPTPTAGDNSTKIATTEFVNTKAGNYLPLSGGTMTGRIHNNSTVFVDRPNDTGELLLFSGTEGGNYPVIALRGKNRSSEAGSFFIRAVDANSGKIFMGKPDGTLTWNGNNIALAKDYLPLSGGTMTGPIAYGSAGSFIRQVSDDQRILICGGSDWPNGADLILYGKDNNAGQFQLVAKNDTADVRLVGSTNGTLTWGGKNVERVNASGTNYIRYESGLQICWGDLPVTGEAVSDATATLPQAFKSSTSYNIVTGRFWAYSTDENYIIKSTTATNFVWSTIGTVSTNNHSYKYIAIGWWK